MENRDNIATMKGQKVVITSDVPFEKVLEYELAGADLFWDLEDFQVIADENLRQLRKPTRDRYAVFRELNQDALKRSPREEKIVEAIKVAPDAGQAASKLEVRNKKEGFDYRWERPDMVDVRLEQGFQFAKGVGTLRGGDSKGIHRIGSNGQDELVLLEIPKERKAELRKQRLARRDKAFAIQKEQAKSEIQRLGGGSVDDSTDSDFRVISQ